MNFKLKIFSIFLITINVLQDSLFAQTTHLDSVILSLKSATNDTLRGNILTELTVLAPDNEWQKYNIALKKLAIDNLYKTKDKKLRNVFTRHLATATSNEGYIYNDAGKISEAIQAYEKSLLMFEQLGHKVGEANNLVDLGMIFHYQGESEKALNNLNKAISIHKKLNQKTGMAVVYCNMGLIYTHLNRFEESLKYLEKSYNLYIIINNKIGISTVLNNMGANFQELNKNSKAIDYFQRALEIRKEIGDKEGVSNSLRNLAGLFYHTKQYKKAQKYAENSLSHARELGFPEEIRNAAAVLKIIYKQQNQFKKALATCELYIQMKDSINNQSTRKASIKSQLKYEYEKQAAADSVAHAKESEIKSVQLQKQTTEIKAKKNQQYALFAGLGLVMIFAGFMFNRFKVTQKQKGIIEEQKTIVEEQKKLVEEKQREVMDSINYARRIQMALIPSEKQIERILKKLKLPNAP